MNQMLNAVALGSAADATRENVILEPPRGSQTVAEHTERTPHQFWWEGSVRIPDVLLDRNSPYVGILKMSAETPPEEGVPGRDLERPQVCETLFVDRDRWGYPPDVPFIYWTSGYPHRSLVKTRV